MFLYSVPALLVFLFIHDAMRKDSTVPDDNMTKWTFVLLAGLLWPITVPCMMRKKVMRWHASLKSETRIA